MSFNAKHRFAVTALLALLANACASSTPRPVRSGEASLVCAGGVIRTEADADAYAGCATVQGDLAIVNSQLSDLGALESLRGVSGSLVIANNPRLISLAGLNGLTRAGSVQIRNNRLLCARLGLLPELGEVTDALAVSSNLSLSGRDINGLREHVKTFRGARAEMAQR
jgi:hypothetical protein